MHHVLARLRERVEPAGLAPAEALALLVLLAGSVALTAVVWWGNSAHLVPPSTAGPSTAASAMTGPAMAGPSASAPSAGPGDGVMAPTEVVVHVVGRVRRPGVVTVQAGARVADAVDAAGGLAADASTEGLNLARPVVDGEQVHVPAVGEEPRPPPPGATASTGGPAEGDDVLDLNLATPAQLDELPGVGPVMAQRIVDHRTAIGGFADVGQLLEVPGIGPARFAELEPRVRV